MPGYKKKKKSNKKNGKKESASFDDIPAFHDVHVPATNCIVENEGDPDAERWQSPVTSSMEIPPLPPASFLRGYSSHEFMTPIRIYNADSIAQDLVYDAWEAHSINDKFKLCQRALKEFPFSVAAFNTIGSIYRDMVPKEGDDALKKAKKAYETAIAAADLLWPNLKDEAMIEWGHVEHRPFLRAYHGLACVHNELGETKDSLKLFRFLLRVNPNDNQGIRISLFYNLIELGEYQEAEQIATDHSNGRNSNEAYFHFGFILIDYLKYKLGCCSQEKLNSTLTKAQKKNQYVVPLLLRTKNKPIAPQYISAGGTDEAQSIVRMMLGPVQNIPGSLEWLKEKQYG